MSPQSRPDGRRLAALLGSGMVSESDGPLDAAQLELVAAARARATKLRTAARVATFNVWTLGIFAVVSALLGLLDPTGLPVAVALAGLSWNEARGRAHLRRFEPKGLQILVRNQLGLLVSLVAYAGWMLYATVTGPDIQEALLEDNPELLELMGGSTDATASLEAMGPWVRTVSIAVYASLIVGVVLFQGGNAWYYASRRKHLDEYLRSTPKWVVELQSRT